MAFNCPAGSDYHNVRSLNRGFLAILAATAGLPAPSQRLQQQVRSLSPPQLERLAQTPFLLFSLRECDSFFWEQLLAHGRERDLFADPPAPADDYGRLVCAALGFIWHLARRNPYATRLICGASLHWCELIGELTMFRLLAIAGSRDDLLLVRHSEHGDLWEKLLDRGISRQNDIREAAHLSALQTILTGPVPNMDASWAVAACRHRRPRLRVAEDPQQQ